MLKSLTIQPLLLAFAAALTIRLPTASPVTGHEKTKTLPEWPGWRTEVAKDGTVTMVYVDGEV